MGPLHATHSLVGERNITQKTLKIGIKDGWNGQHMTGGISRGKSMYDFIGNFKKIRFYSDCNEKPLKVPNRGAWNAIYIFNSPCVAVICRKGWTRQGHK